MGLETGNYITDFTITNPTASDNVSQGDDHLRLVKKLVKQSFPSVDQAVNAIHTSTSAPSASISAGLLWFDTTNNVLKLRNEANDAWVTLPISAVTSNTVDIDGGAIDGTAIGAASASTAVVSSLNVNADGATVTGIKDEDDMSSDSAVKLATQQSIKAYVDTQLTAEDLDFQGDSGTGEVDLDSQTLDIAGGSGITTTASSQTLTVAGDDATTSAKGVASFSSDNFSVSSGAVTIKDAGVANAELADMAANTVKVRNANSSGVPSDLALATTEIMIGDGTGFTAAALSGDVSMTNAGAVTVDSIQGTAVSSTAPTNDQYMKYSSTSSEWQMVSIVGSDKLTTKGDLLVYNTVDSETRMGVGTNDYVLVADSTATNGVDWKQIVDAGIDASAGIDATKIADGTVTDTEFQYVGGLTSDAQTQLDGKSATTGNASIATVGTVSSGTWEATDVAVLHGGTGASSASSARTNLGLVIGTNVQAYDADTAKTDTDQSWTGSQRATAVTDNDGSYDMDLGQNFITTPSGATTITFTNITDGQSGFIKLINSGGETISLHTNTKGDANIATTVSTTGTYLLSYFSDGTDVWLTNSAIYA